MAISVDDFEKQLINVQLEADPSSMLGIFNSLHAKSKLNLTDAVAKEILDCFEYKSLVAGIFDDNNMDTYLTWSYFLLKGMYDLSDKDPGCNLSEFKIDSIEQQVFNEIKKSVTEPQSMAIARLLVVDAVNNYALAKPIFDMAFYSDDMRPPEHVMLEFIEKLAAGNVSLRKNLLNYTLVVAVIKDQPSLVSLLIEKGACVNSRQISGPFAGVSPLYIAVVNSKERIVEMLLSNGAHYVTEEAAILCFQTPTGTSDIISKLFDESKLMRNIAENVLTKYVGKLPAKLNITFESQQEVLLDIYKALFKNRKAVQNIIAASRLYCLVDILVQTDLSEQNVAKQLGKLASSVNQKQITSYFALDKRKTSEEPVPSCAANKKLRS